MDVPVSVRFAMFALFVGAITATNARRTGSRGHFVLGSIFAAGLPVMSRLAHLGIIKGKGMAQVVPAKDYSAAEIVLACLPTFAAWFTISLAMAMGVAHLMDTFDMGPRKP